MAVNSFNFALNTAANTSRGPSDVIWSKFPSTTAGSQPGQVMHFFDDFLMTGNNLMSSASQLSIGQWSAYGYAGAQVNDGQLEGGVAILSADGDQEGLAMLSSTGAFQFCTANSTTAPGYKRKMFFEARVARSSVATAKSEFFVGLMAPTLSSGLPAAAQPITTTDDTLMTAGDLFGFHCCSSTGVRGGMTEVALAFVKASGTVNYPTNMTTLLASSGNAVLTAGTFVKLGFIFDPDALVGIVPSSCTARQTAGTYRKKLLRVFVNGLEVPTFLSSDDIANATSGQLFPIAQLAPVIAHMDTTGSTPGTTSIDWIRVAQLGTA